METIVWPEVLRTLAAQLAWFLAALLCASALNKVLRFDHARDVARSFAGVSAALAGVAAAVVVAWESSAAIALAFPPTRPAGAVAAVALWFVYLVLLVRSLVSDRPDVDCGCSFGTPTAGVHAPVGTFQIVRNSVLMVLACPIAAGAAGSFETAPSQILAALALLALYAALDQVMNLRPLRRGEVS